MDFLNARSENVKDHIRFFHGVNIAVTNWILHFNELKYPETRKGRFVSCSHESVQTVDNPEDLDIFDVVKKRVKLTEAEEVCKEIVENLRTELVNNISVQIEDIMTKESPNFFDLVSSHLNRISNPKGSSVSFDCTTKMIANPKVFSKTPMKSLKSPTKTNRSPSKTGKSPSKYGKSPIMREKGPVVPDVPSTSKSIIKKPQTMQVNVSGKRKIPTPVKGPGAMGGPNSSAGGALEKRKSLPIKASIPQSSTTTSGFAKPKIAPKSAAASERQERAFKKAVSRSKQPSN